MATQTSNQPQSAPLLQGSVLALFYTGMATMNVFVLEWSVRYLHTGRNLPISLEIREMFWQYIAFFSGCALWTIYSLYMSRPTVRAAIGRRLDPETDLEVASILLALVFGIASCLFLSMAAAHSVLLVTGGVLTHGFFRRCVHGQSF